MPAIKPRATIAADKTDRYMPARLKVSFQARPRDASSDQCSVDRIWRRIWTGVGPPPDSVGSMALDRDAGTGGSAGAGAARSNDILAPPSCWPSLPAPGERQRVVARSSAATSDDRAGRSP